jgi:wyosine [tRNA(Phe)-imidazoG37] synthetase (radical SAM superfamily)
MPSHARVTEFGFKLAGLLGVELLKEKPDSRVVLLGDRSERTELEP